MVDEFEDDFGGYDSIEQYEDAILSKELRKSHELESMASVRDSAEYSQFMQDYPELFDDPQ
jgi:hypothetical protein